MNDFPPRPARTEPRATLTLKPAAGLPPCTCDDPAHQLQHAAQLVSLQPLAYLMAAVAWSEELEQPVLITAIDGWEEDPLQLEICLVGVLQAAKRWGILEYVLSQVYAAEQELELDNDDDAPPPPDGPTDPHAN